MKENDILNAIDLITKDKRDLELQIEQLDSMLRRYKAMLFQYEYDRKEALVFNNNNIEDTIVQITPNMYGDSLYDKDFPIGEKIDEQIIYLLRKIGRAVKLPKLDALYQQYSGTNRQISNIARRMKSEDKLVVAQFNDANIYSFWGLPEWVIIDDYNRESYKEENMPSREDLQFGHNTIKFY